MESVGTWTWEFRTGPSHGPSPAARLPPAPSERVSDPHGRRRGLAGLWGKGARLAPARPVRSARRRLLQPRAGRGRAAGAWVATHELAAAGRHQVSGGARAAGVRGCSRAGRAGGGRGESWAGAARLRARHPTRSPTRALDPRYPSPRNRARAVVQRGIAGAALEQPPAWAPWRSGPCRTHTGGHQVGLPRRPQPSDPRARGASPAGAPPRAPEKASPAGSGPGAGPGCTARGGLAQPPLGPPPEVPGQSTAKDTPAEPCPSCQQAPRP